MEKIEFNAAKTKDNVINWIREYFEKNGPDCKAVVGISGGKDSSIVAALCVQALGEKRTFGVLMPQGEQNDIDFSHELVSLLGIEHIIVNIKDSVDVILAAIKENELPLNRQAVVNTPARIRMTVLYAVSAIVNGRVANTCNFSEDYIGYSTKYGDNAGDFSPLSQLTVTEIKAIGKELLPVKFIDKLPQDGLSGLSDEENLGFSYDVLDRYIREGICADSVIKEKIDKLHITNKHKLELMPAYGKIGQ
ncbi:MAG: NAD(+) synthase [Treponema sp.]|jgi:NAD+ synthase|nr:NAD(+) synthase [Treponema sp.]